MGVIDTVITEDRFSSQASGITSYCNKESILGILWWKYIGMSLRSRGAHLVIGGKFCGDKLLIISRALGFAQKVYLTG